MLIACSLAISFSFFAKANPDLSPDITKFTKSAVVPTWKMGSRPITSKAS